MKRLPNRWLEIFERGGEVCEKLLKVPSLAANKGSSTAMASRSKRGAPPTIDEADEDGGAGVMLKQAYLQVSKVKDPKVLVKRLQVRNYITLIAQSLILS